MAPFGAAVRHYYSKGEPTQMGVIERKRALLMSGGVGDYLHYLTRLDSWINVNGIDPQQLTIFVESTVPMQVASLFARAFQYLHFEFLPAAIHWTKTNPLLVAESETDRINRPAYRFVAERGFDSITDWFLPFSCREYKSDEAPLTRIVTDPQIMGRYLVIAARDKGFLWWPHQDLCREIEAMIPIGMQLVYLGTPNERQDYMRGFLNTNDVAEALSISYHAALFIGTDTGTATIRELTGRKNIYCVNRFWVDELMVRYGYWNDSLRHRSKSVFTFSADHFLSVFATELAVLANDKSTGVVRSGS